MPTGFLMLQRNLILFILLVLCGCTKDMAIQNKLLFQTQITPQAPIGTITTTGQDANGSEALRTVTPVIDIAFLKRGEERFNIHCAPCHDRTGSGNGLVVQRGFPHPLNLATEQIRALSDQELFGAITNGYKTMAGYRTFISTQDRVAIVGYVRVLQLARNFQASDLEQVDRDQLDKLGAK